MGYNLSLTGLWGSASQKASDPQAGEYPSRGLLGPLPLPCALQPTGSSHRVPFLHVLPSSVWKAAVVTGAPAALPLEEPFPGPWGLYSPMWTRSSLPQGNALCLSSGHDLGAEWSEGKSLDSADRVQIPALPPPAWMLGQGSSSPSAFLVPLTGMK